MAVREGGEAVLLRPDVKLFGAELWSRRRGLTPLISEAERDERLRLRPLELRAGGPGAGEAGGGLEPASVR